jgi:hypothetical protein
MLQGPISGHTMSFVNIESPKFVFDSMPSMNISSGFVIATPVRPKFNLSEFKSSIQMNAQYTTKFVDHLLHMTNYLSDKYDTMLDIQGDTYFHFSMASYISIMFRLISYFVDYVVLISLLRSGQWLLGITPIVLVDAVQADSFFSMESLLDSQIVGLSMDFVFLIGFAVAVFYIIRRRRLNQVLLSVCHGVIRSDSRSDYHLHVNYVIRTQNFFHSVEQLIDLTIPITWLSSVPNGFKLSKNIELMTRTNLFVITKRDDSLGVLLVAPLFFAYAQDNSIDRATLIELVQLFVPFNDIKWGNDRMPKGFTDSTYGTSYLHLLQQ